MTKDNANAVAVIDTSSNTVIATMNVGAAPAGVSIAPDGKHAYVASVGTNSVVVIDTSSNSVTATVALGTVDPVGFAFTPDGSRVYVLDAGGNLTVIATSSNSVTATVILPGNEISPLAGHQPDGTRAYVTRFAANTEAVIDNEQHRGRQVPLGAFPAGWPHAGRKTCYGRLRPTRLAGLRQRLRDRHVQQHRSRQSRRPSSFRAGYQGRRSEEVSPVPTRHLLRSRRSSPPAAMAGTPTSHLVRGWK